MEYNYGNLSYYDFELLCQDVLSDVLDVNLSSFRRGRDGGIDLRCFFDDSSMLIVQCKHYLNSTFSNLKSSMEKEIVKMKDKNVTRYVLATSLELNVNQKYELKEIMQPYCLTEDDIFSGNDINFYLRKNPKIIRNHYKLWITSTSILERIFHSNIYNRQDFIQESINEDMKFYVHPVKAFNKTLKILYKFNTCIISGVPGIGKTTLAKSVISNFAAEGYELIPISESISEGISLYNSEEKQMFYYDDFLGNTGLDLKWGKNEDSEIIQFLNRISKSNNKKMILTTREYILNQAKQKSEAMENESFEYNNYVISLEDYSKYDRAKILYNNLYFNNFSNKHLNQIIKNKYYLNIINHENYNPRIINDVLNKIKVNAQDNLREKVITALDNPEQIWRHAFENQISDSSRDLLLVMVILPTDIELDELKPIYTNYRQEKAKKYNFPFTSNDFRKAIKELQGNFIQLELGAVSKRPRVSYHNPSIQGFIESYIGQHPEEYLLLCKTTEDLIQVIGLYNLSKRKNNEMLIKRYEREFVDLLISFITIDITRDKYYRDINKAISFARLDSISNRGALLFKINEDLQSPVIKEYIENGFNEFFDANIYIYNEKLSNLEGFLTMVSRYKKHQLLQSYLIKSIFEYAKYKVLKVGFSYVFDIELFITLENEFKIKLDYNIINAYNDFKEDEIGYMERSVQDGAIRDSGEIEELRDNIIEYSTFYNIDYSMDKDVLDSLIEKVDSRKEEADNIKGFAEDTSPNNEAKIDSLFETLISD